MKISPKLIFITVIFILSTHICAAEQKKDNSKFLIGFNQGWIHNYYGRQFTESGFDANEFKRVFKLSKSASANIVRFWLFPGHDPIFFKLVTDHDSYRILNEQTEYLKYVEQMIKISAKEGVKLNLTLFNGVDSHFDIKDKAHINFWGHLLNDKYSVLDRFLDGPLQKLLDLIDSKESYRETVAQMDIANEINAYAIPLMNNGIKFYDGRPGMNKFICKVYNKIKSHKAGSHIDVTASLGYGLEQIDLITNNVPWPKCVDFFDIHSYSNNGHIRGCKNLVSYAKKHGKKIQLGEFGQFQIPEFIDNGTQSELTKNFLLNAKKCGFSGALAWRLTESGVAERYNYNAGKTQFNQGKFETDKHGNRPAFYVFKRTAQQILSQ